MLQLQLDIERLYSHISERLKARRDEKHITQELLARRSGVARSSIANFEKGRQRLPLHSLYQLCAALDIEPGSVLPTIAEIAEATAARKDGIPDYLPAKATESIEMLRHKLKTEQED